MNKGSAIVAIIIAAVAGFVGGQLSAKKSGGEAIVADKPEGMRHVIVNGTVIREDEKPLADALAQRPGKLLRS